MNEKVIAVTPPDDILEDADRILLVDLTESQTQMISQALGKLEEFSTIVLYMWKTGDDNDWCLDKKLKSNLIIFNADSENQTTVGYLAAQRNSFYFGILKNISNANTNAIYDIEQLITILERNLR